METVDEGNVRKYIRKLFSLPIRDGNQFLLPACGRLVSIFQPTYKGWKHDNESITLKLQKSANGSDWADTGIELTATNVDGEVLPATFELSGAKYRVRAEVSGTAPDYDVELWVTTRS